MPTGILSIKLLLLIYYEGSSKPAYYKVYQHIAESLIEERVLTQDNLFVAVTEHTISNNEKVLVMVNYSPETAFSNFKLQDGWKISKSLYGVMPHTKFEIKAKDALVLIVKK